MLITCAMSQNVPYKDANGTVQLCTLRPGRHNYPMLDHKDPLLSETLRVLRKLGKVKFDELLPGDHEIMKNAPKGKDPVEHLAEKVLAKPNPVGRKVNLKSDERKAKEAKAAKEKKKNVRGTNSKNAPKGGSDPKSSDLSGESGGVSGKK
jgi:hypothetical protein